MQNQFEFNSNNFNKTRNSKKVREIEFSAESKLRIIENYAFACIPNKSFIFPSILKKIKKKNSFKLIR